MHQYSWVPLVERRRGAYLLRSDEKPTSITWHSASGGMRRSRRSVDLPAAAATMRNFASWNRKPTGRRWWVSRAPGGAMVRLRNQPTHPTVTLATERKGRVPSDRHDAGRRMRGRARRASRDEVATTSETVSRPPLLPGIRPEQATGASWAYLGNSSKTLHPSRSRKPARTEWAWINSPR